MKATTTLILFCLISPTIFAQGNASPVIPGADGFVIIKGAKIQPDKNKIYKAIYDATKAPKDSTLILPAINMAGSELNALGVCNIPINHAKFIVAFHGAALYGILDNSHYREKFGVDNPNLAVLADLKKAGVQLFACGQDLLGKNIDFKTISPDVSVASDALVVLMTFQSMGYALMSF